MYAGCAYAGCACAGWVYAGVLFAGCVQTAPRKKKNDHLITKERKEFRTFSNDREAAGRAIGGDYSPVTHASPVLHDHNR